MLSISAYNLLNTFIPEEETAHELRFQYSNRGAEGTILDEMLLSALIELTKSEFVTWSIIDPNGKKIEETRCPTSVPLLIEDWLKVFGTDGPRGECWSSNSIEFRITKAGKFEANRDGYKPYAPFLRDWHEWSVSVFDEEE